MQGRGALLCQRTTTQQAASRFRGHLFRSKRGLAARQPNSVQARDVGRLPDAQRKAIPALGRAAHPPSSQLVAFIRPAPGMPRLRRSLKHRPLDNSTGSDDPTPRFAHRPCGPHCRSPDAGRRDRTRPRLTCRRIKKEPKRDAVNGLPHHQRNSHHRAVVYLGAGHV